MGVALNTRQIEGLDTAATAVVEKHFNSIVAENCMKSMYLQPVENEFFFDEADQFVAYGERNKMHMVGHTLIWHSQVPAWFFTDENGNEVTREVLIERMKSHISTVVGRYKGRIHGWDVVNEAIEDDGQWRNSKFYRIIGEEFVEIAFRAAAAADPDAELYYNDFNMAKEGKRNAVVAMVKKLQEKGVKIDGIGMQGHMLMDAPTLEDFEASIAAFAGLGVKVMITEMDISVLPWPTREVSADISLYFERKDEYDPFTQGISEEMLEAQTRRYADFFSLFLKYKENISRVTLWGVNDKQSWKNNFPIRGRTDYALIFDRNNQPKPAVERIIELARKSK
jgi:endo-1,4-beta-xylanase